jgi:fatty acid desaturase
MSECTVPLRIDSDYRWVGFGALLVFIVSLGLCFALAWRSDWWTLTALVPMVFVYHGTHEAVHDTLVPRWLLPTRTRRVLADLLGTLGFSIVGHNYLYLRWSHRQHHAFGRLDATHTIDGKLSDQHSFPNLRYYACLAGFNCYLHELSGYIYALIPAEYNIVDRRFDPSLFPYKLYLITQTCVLTVTVALFYFGGVYFLVCRILFSMYWGMMQNVAHYGLEHGSMHAARTYRVASLLEFLLFKAGFRHVEHHACPGVPGYCLDDPRVTVLLRRRIGFCPAPKIGISRYVGDVLRQLRGPEGRGVDREEWRKVG